MRQPRLNPRELVTVALFAALIVALGFVYIPLPFTPVPIQAQTLGVMLAGCLLGRRLGTASVLVFLSLAAVGVPVLAGGRGGIGVFFGPTGGYLVGYAIAPAIIGLIAQGAHRRPAVWVRLAVANVAGGILAIYVPGVLYLAYVTHRSLVEAILMGAVPFLVGDLFKAVAATLVAEGVHAAYPLERILSSNAATATDAG